MYLLHELRARCSGAIVTNFWAANTVPHLLVVASTVALVRVPLAIAPLAVVHFSFRVGGLLIELAVAFGFFLEAPLVC